MLSLAVAASLGLVSASASAVGDFKEFTVDENSVPGVPTTSTFEADKINGSYNEVLTVNNNGSFDTVGYANWTSYLFNDGGDVVQDYYLGSAGATGYSMYATFSSSGYLTATGFTGLVGSFLLYIDPNKDTTKSLPGSGSGDVVVGGTSDDYLIAFATNLISGLGVVGTPGAFDLIFNDFTLTTGDNNAGTAGTQNGDLYFTEPRPFHLLVQTNGDFDKFPTVPGPGTYSNITGDISAVFKVPEPGSLAMLGLGLLGLGMSRRRKA